MIARDIFLECCSSYLSVYGFDEKKKGMRESLRNVSFEDLKNVIRYAALQHRESTFNASMAAMIQTLAYEACAAQDQTKADVATPLAAAPLRCDACSVTFADQTDLKTHTALKHPTKKVATREAAKKDGAKY